MRTVSLAAVGTETPVLGFGCSALTGTVRRTALRVLHTAFDCGVRHFDVARYYGYGEAEAILGSFARSCRTQITITTKFGIEPPRDSAIFRMVLKAGRRLTRLLPQARSLVQAQTRHVIRKSIFNVANAARSLETSLRELGTDYVDFYLLHDYSLETASSDDLVGFLEDSRRAGKIRAFGIATAIESTLRCLELQPQLCGIVQFRNSAIHRNIENLGGKSAGRTVFTHGSLAGDYPHLRAFIDEREDLARQWSDALGLDCSSRENLASLMLNYAVEANANGPVLFSSRNPERVRKNVEWVAKSSVSAEQVRLFARLVQQAGLVISLG